jgi:hypothetical protein
MKYIAVLSVASAVFFSLPSQAAGEGEQSLLGVPFGGKLALAQCPSNTDHAKKPCWVDKPFTAKDGTRLGSAHLPNPDQRPAWAAHAMFRLQIDKADRVQEIQVKVFNAAERFAIAESISKRFGQPRENALRRLGTSWASWSVEAGRVEISCADECWVEFRTPLAQAARDLEQAGREKVNANRPKAP